jgi:hypothetical protein
MSDLWRRAGAEFTGTLVLDDFGAPDTFWKIRVRHVPAVVTMDSHARSLHAEVEQTSRRNLAELLAQGSAMETVTYDLIILGTGLAELRAVLEAASVSRGKLDIALVAKLQLMRAHSAAAEGNTAAPLRPGPGRLPALGNTVAARKRRDEGVGGPKRLALLRPFHGRDPGPHPGTHRRTCCGPGGVALVAVLLVCALGLTHVITPCATGPGQVNP